MKITPANFIVSLLLTLTGLVAQASPTSIDPANYTLPIRVACVGDSITYGVGADPGKSYPSQLQGLLGDKWQVKNFGFSARTLLKKGDSPYSKEQAFKDAHDWKPNVVIIMLGTNDTKPPNWIHHEEFYGDYKDFVESFKNLSNAPRIFICQPTPIPEPGNYGINETNLKIEIPLIQKVAAEEKVDIIDMHAALESKPELLPDHVHPNTAGAGLMAQAAAAALTGKTSP